MRSHALKFATMMLALSTSASHALAEDDEQEGFAFHGMVAGGVGFLPEYQGGTDYEMVPLILGQFDAFGMSLEHQGLGANLNILPGGAFEFGIAGLYEPGRKDVSNAQVSKLPEIDGAFNLGGFARYNFDALLAPQDELSIELDVLADVTGTYDGFVATLDASYSTQFAERWFVGFDAGMEFADANYMETYFGVGAASPSGLAAYEPDAGLKSVNVNATVGFALSESLSLVGRAGYTRLLGEAADSPIVKDTGSPDQFFVGTGVMFRF